MPRRFPTGVSTGRNSGSQPNCSGTPTRIPPRCSTPTTGNTGRKRPVRCGSFSSCADRQWQWSSRAAVLLAEIFQGRAPGAAVSRRRCAAGIEPETGDGPRPGAAGHRARAAGVHRRGVRRHGCLLANSTRLATSSSRLALAAKPGAAALVASAQAMQAARTKLEILMRRNEAAQPLALASTLIEEYTRNDPRRRALWRLREDPALDQTSAGFASAFADLQPARPPATVTGREVAVDGSLARLALRDAADFTSRSTGSRPATGTDTVSRMRRGGSPSSRPERSRARFVSKAASRRRFPSGISRKRQRDYIGTVRVRGPGQPGQHDFPHHYVPR